MHVNPTLGPAALALLASTLVAQAAPVTQELLAAHYLRVEQELVARDTRALLPEQREARTRALELLREYRRRGDFGVDGEPDGGRVPLFVDGDGRRCAVGWILDGLGAGDLTLRVQREANQAWIVDLAGDPELESRLAAIGLSLAEAARIQAPSMRQPRRAAPPPPPPPPPPPVYDGPADSPAAAPRSGGATRSRGSGSSQSGTGSSTMATGAVRGATTGRVIGTPAFAVEVLDWGTWWQWQRARLLHAAPRPVAPAVPGTTRVGDGAERARAELVALITEQLDDHDARVRAAAVVALGRIGGGEAVPALVARLEDQNLQVREAAILALGANGATRAVHALAHLARSGRKLGVGERVSPHAQALAVIALGLARGAGGASLDALVGSAADPHQDASSAAARLVYPRLAPPAAPAAFPDASEDAALDLRCRAIENLGFVPDRAAVGRLTRALSGRDLELRRAAAVALGSSSDALALPALMTAFELERESLTRGFVLLAIGEHAVLPARDFLLHVLDSGDKTLRPWAALAAGIWARSNGDMVVQEAIRLALIRENNRDVHGPYLLAAGLARDPKSIHRLEAALRSSSPDTRVLACEALGLLGGAEARRVLRTRFANEPCIFVRAAVVEALGAIGVPEDAALALAVLEKARGDDPRARLAFALSRLDSDEAHRALVRLAGDPAGDPEMRAAALEALGAKLDPRGPRLPRLAANVNWAVLPDWLRTVLGSTL